jgi:hypothetical protein
VLLPVYHGPLQEDNRSFGNRFNLNEGLSRTPAVEYFAVKIWTIWTIWDSQCSRGGSPIESPDFGLSMLGRTQSHSLHPQRREKLQLRISMRLSYSPGFRRPRCSSKSNQSFNPLPARICGVYFSTRDARVADCLAAAIWKM